MIRPSFSRRILTATVLLVASALSAWNEAAAQQKVDPATKQLLAAHGFFRAGMYKPAAEEFAAFIAKNPKHAEVSGARYGLGVCQYRLKQYPQAVQTLEAVLKDPAFAQRDEALAILGHCRLAQADHAKALAAFDELLAKYPKSKHAELTRLNRAQVLYLLGKPDQALAACQQFVKAYPSSARRASAMYFMALSQEALGRYGDAVKTLATLAKSFPKNPYAFDAMLLSGRCFEGLGQSKQAIAQYQAYLKAAPKSGQAKGHYSLGIALYNADQHAEAAKQFSAVLTQFAKSEYVQPARLQLGLAQLGAGKPAQARKTLAEVAKKDPKRAQTASYWLAQCDIAEKKYPAARKILDALAAAKPAPSNLSDVQYDRALCAMSMAQWAQAAKEFAAFRTAHATSSHAPEALYRQAFCLHKLGQHKQSLALCKTAAKSKGTADAVADLAAENLFLLGQYGEAQKAYEARAQAAKDPQAKARVAFRLGQCRYFTGDYAKALTYLKPIADDPKSAKDPQLADAIFLAGDALLQTHQYAAAAKALARYLPVATRYKAEAHFKLALAQLRGGQPAQADKTLQAVMAGGGNSPWVRRAMFEYGQLAYKNKQPAKAAVALAKVVAAKDPPELLAPAMYLLACIDADAKRHAQAAARFAQVAQQFPKHALASQAAYQQAVALKAAGQAAKALPLLEKYLKDHPQASNARQVRRLIGTCLDETGQHAQAAKIFAALAADKTGRDAAVLYELAWSQRRAKDLKAAAETYRSLLKDFPADPLATPARTELAELLYDQKQYVQAAALLVKALADAKADPKVRLVGQYRLGFCHARLKDHAKAAAVFAAFAKAYPKDDLTPSAVYQAGLANALQNQHPAAQQHFGRLLTSWPKHELAPAARLKLGESQNASGAWAQAGATFQLFLKTYPTSKLAPLAEFGIGWSLEQQKQYAGARTWYAKVIEHSNGPTAARARFQIGETHFAQGQFEKAAHELLKVEMVYPYPEWSARALYDAGRAYEQLKRPDDAKKQYETCVKKYKDQPVAKLAQKRLDALGAAAS